MLQTTKTTPDKSKPLRDQLETVAGSPPVWTKDAYGNHYAWLHLNNPSELRPIAEALAGQVRLCTITAYAEERDDTDKRRRIAYHFASGRILLTVTVPIYDPESLQKLPVPSITPWFRNADWNEREFHEMFNIDIEGHPNPKRLFLDERLDAGIMSKLIPFSAMANSAGTNTLWERILEAKGVPPEERLPSLTAPAEPIKLEPSFTPVSAPQNIEPSLATPTLANVAKSAEEAARLAGRKAAVPAASPTADVAGPKSESNADAKQPPASKVEDSKTKGGTLTAKDEPKAAAPGAGAFKNEEPRPEAGASEAGRPATDKPVVSGAETPNLGGHSPSPAEEPSANIQTAKAGSLNAMSPASDTAISASGQGVATQAENNSIQKTQNSAPDAGVVKKEPASGDANIENQFSKTDARSPATGLVNRNSGEKPPAIAVKHKAVGKKAKISPPQKKKRG